ncbi:universal stress protein [Telmatospirillum sp. J64-1]|uniref:universal stress protein n=1 Tax=Telmatospirillum sp. J64-1 TaxID=2502183 RepID=UPI00163D429B|nr:universal stress protein [Telmatospirillum sp. J64-1]
MARNILVALDLSPSSLNVLIQAGHMMAGGEGRLHAVHALAGDSGHEAALTQLLQFKGLLPGELQDRVDMDVVTGGAAAILGKAAELAADLLVVGPASRRSWFDQVTKGSTTVQLMRAAKVPILVVRKSEAAHYAMALAPVDVEAEFRDNVRMARDVLEDVPLALLAVLADSTRMQMIAAEARPEAVKKFDEDSLARAQGVLELIAEEVATPDWRPSCYVTIGDPVEAVQSWRMTLGADVLVLRPSGKSLIERLLFGSVSEALVQDDAECDVLVLPPPQD